MRIHTVAQPHALADAAAGLVATLVRAAPHARIGLPTGETPLETYAALARRVASGTLDLSRATGYAIDEFAGATHAAPGTNAAFYARHITFPLAALHCPDNAAPDPGAEIAAFAMQLTSAGRLDLCLLGIGVNGHIAFNEPGAAVDSRARVVALAPSSRQAHASAFGGIARVPSRAMTLGIADLLESRTLVVLAHGPAKANIVRAALNGPETPELPASWLRRHPDITWLLDEAAASALTVP